MKLVFWYSRAARRADRREAITSRPLLLTAVGTAVRHTNQTRLHLRSLEGRAAVLKRPMANIGPALRQ